MANGGKTKDKKKKKQFNHIYISEHCCPLLCVMTQFCLGCENETYERAFSYYVLVLRGLRRTFLFTTQITTVFYSKAFIFKIVQYISLWEETFVDCCLGLHWYNLGCYLLWNLKRQTFQFATERNM